MSLGPTLPPPALQHLCDLAVQVAEPVDVGETPLGRRRLVAILGGEVAGPAMRGKVLAGGADYQLIVGGSVAQLDARYVIELDDGARVFVHNTALRVATPEVTAQLLRGEPVPSEAVYFRCQPRFECASPHWAWLQQHQFIGTGQRDPSCVRMSFYCVR